MTTTDITGHPPIYDLLIQELGDAPAEARKAAEDTQDQAREALDWSTIHARTAEPGRYDTPRSTAR
ncbi:hypothetical protein [Streptomyces sp. NPDC058394]|uniref:hypothetical protein n=1 Tax=Streptomyces sp. NPDC058394 TaxID=3346477 RepID=UPI00365AA869